MAKAEQRSYIRINKHFSVSFCKVGAFLRFGSNTKSVSEGGLSLPFAQNFPVGCVLEMEIRSEDLKIPIKALVRVAWTAKMTNNEFPYEGGVQFIQIDPGQLEILRNYINSYNIRWVD